MVYSNFGVDGPLLDCSAIIGIKFINDCKNIKTSFIIKVGKLQKLLYELVK